MSAAEPVRDGEGADIVGPRNAERERQDPFAVRPPTSDHGAMPNLKWSFADSHIRIEEGGWARETTIRELPISKAMAGVNMRLKAGAVRELHWHKEAEWSYMLKGKARITAVNEVGRTFADDVCEGDLWYFPPGIPHSIQGLDSEVDGCEFLPVFDDGNFSEDSTFLLTDWLAHTPRDVLAKNFRTSEDKLQKLPSKKLYLFPAPKPGALSEDRKKGPARSPTSLAITCCSRSRTRWREAPSAHRGFHELRSLQDDRRRLGRARARRPARVALASNSDKWQYYIEGEGRMTLFGSESKARTFDYRAGDGYVPFAMGHYIENTGIGPLRFLEMFQSERYADLSLNQWLALTPLVLVEAHLKIDPEVVAGLSTAKVPVLPK